MDAGPTVLSALLDRALILIRRMTKFADWPTWLQYAVLAPHGILAAVACWLWWPKSDVEWRKFGLVVAYLLAFFFVMRYAFDMK